MTDPKYRKHTRGDFAFVEHEGHRIRLPGRFDSAESKEAYQIFLCQREQQSIGPHSSRGRQGEKTVAGLVLAFLNFARTHYPGGHSNEYLNCRCALKPLVETYGDQPIGTFGPRMLKYLQQVMVHRGWKRDYLNAQIARVKRMFKWGVSEELVPLTVLQSLQTVQGLRRGRTAAKEATKRQPVAWEHVEPILVHLPPNVAAMVQMQWLTGARSQSICAAKPEQFDRATTPWSWKPRHKTEHLGREIVIFIGPKLAPIIEPFFDRPAGDHLFAPRESAKWWAAWRAEHGRPPSHGRKLVNRRIRKAYDTWSYRQAIRRAQTKAGVPPWTPHQLRHARATLVRSEYGLEAAQAVLCHHSIEATQIYAAKRQDLARAVALQSG